MQRNEFKRVKHGQQPGDISKQAKIAMREGKTPLKIFSWHTISDSSGKKYRKMLIEKSKTVQRRRDKEATSQDD